MIIAQVGNPIINDFYTLSGTDIPEDAVIEFTAGYGTVPVVPDFIRPHLAFVERLPASIPAGDATVTITSPSTASSNTLRVNVRARAAETVRTLHGGDTKTQPYTIAFVANPGIQPASGSNFHRDPVLSDRPSYHAIVTHCLQNLFLSVEDLLREANRDARMRLVSIFDSSRPANAANSLAHELAGGVMETRRDVLAAFLARYGVVADVVFVIHGSSTHTTASSWFTTDDSTRATTNYTYDGVRQTHGHFPRIPGSVALPMFLDTTGLIVIHEFGHAASDFNSGKVTDLYVDSGSGTGFLINKKFRGSTGSLVPTSFADLDTTNFASDPTRGSLTYPSDWRSFHPELVDTRRPNLMDNFWFADDPVHCRFDRLTSKWLRDRLDTKLSR
jgi:hypothetical protein